VSADPRGEYQRRLGERRREAARLATLERRISVSRLLVFGLVALVAWLALEERWFAPLWILLPAAVFVALLVVHDRTIRSRVRSERAAAFYAAGVSRLEHTWAGHGRGGERFLDDQHPYAADLDLFGRGSLFELLCTARLQAGEETLAGWLLSAAPPDEIRARHAAIAELRPRLDLREEFSLLGEDLRGALDPSSLTRWAAEPPWRVAPWLRLACVLSPAFTVAALSAWYVSLLGPWPLLVAALAQLALAESLRARVGHTVRAVAHPAHELELLSQMLGRLEREPFESPRLRALQAALECEGEPPSRRIARLRRLVDLLDAHRNQFFAPIAIVLLWRPNFALAIEAWRTRSGAAVPRWLAAIGELEAFSSLASHAWEHPGDPFPDLVDQGPLVDGTGLGHPLIAEERCVRNDVRLGGNLRLLIVSGSNMSGKSTLLRTVGINAVLAFAGAPVRADRMRLSPLVIGASIHVLDSLQDGTSRFYAEVRKLGRIVGLAQGEVPLLFLLDEILSGTNSHDRAIGAEAVVRGLVERRAVGLITTHDLALARIAASLDGLAANVHFEDHLEDGHMIFDYRMRQGVVTKSNALALMRAVGLNV
jgi:hypothetical protein